ncbi:DUF1622 domain-containing protein [Sphingomonas daechungensis]|uniref:DUF1622 domain-containing protein n=2 Tax=Sphingomonas daechungensis TaxID=1176646 RepID=A0ABX6T234_9SPHN|nr:DUF1622 domain-containing protein [Sphingomonas daechungensis]
MIEQIEITFRLIASFFALFIEAAAVTAVVIGAVEALYASFRNLGWSVEQSSGDRGIWVRFASWILLSLEFALGADIIRTAIAPTWDEIGKLAAIAGIRTALNFFLGRDVEQAERFRAEKRKDA